MPAHEVTVEFEGVESLVDADSLRQLAVQVMQGEAVAADRALGVLLTTDAELRRLNRRFRGIDQATDVLSFADEPLPGFVGSSAALGDIALSLETAQRQAVDAGRELEREVRHLLVHGLLHLCGHDHEAGPDEAGGMRQREEHYLGDLSDFHEINESR